MNNVLLQGDLQAEVNIILKRFYIKALGMSIMSLRIQASIGVVEHQVNSFTAITLISST